MSTPSPETPGGKLLKSMREMMDDGRWAEIPPRALKVLMVLTIKYRNDRNKAWPGLEELALKCGCHRSTVVDALRWLRDHGFVELLKRGRLGECSTYRVNLPATTAAPGIPGAVEPEHGSSCAPKTRHSVPQKPVAQRRENPSPSAGNPGHLQPIKTSPVKAHNDNGASLKGTGRKRPGLADIELADLNTDAGLVRLYRRAVAEGFIDPTGHDKDHFFGGIARSVRLGHDPQLLFEGVTPGGNWPGVTPVDLEAGQGMIKRLRDAEPPAEAASQTTLQICR